MMAMYFSVHLCVHFLCDLCGYGFFTTENTEEMHTEIHSEKVISVTKSLTKQF